MRKSISKFYITLPCEIANYKYSFKQLKQYSTGDQLNVFGDDVRLSYMKGKKKYDTLSFPLDSISS